MLYRDIEFARLDTIPETDDEEVYTQYLRFLRNPNTPRRYWADTGNAAIRAATNMYERTGNRAWKTRMQALVDEQESFQEEMGHVSPLYMIHGGYVSTATDMSHAAARETIVWYERFDARHPEFDCPLFQHRASSNLIRCYATVGDLVGVLRMNARLQQLKHLIPSAPGAEVRKNILPRSSH